MVMASVSTFQDHKATPAARVAARRCFSLQTGIVSSPEAGSVIASAGLMALFRWKRRHPRPGFCDRQKLGALLWGAELARHRTGIWRILIGFSLSRQRHGCGPSHAATALCAPGAVGALIDSGTIAHGAACAR